MIDLTTMRSQYITYIGFTCIAILFLCFVVVEIRFTQRYQNSFNTDKKAIDFLKTQRKKIRDLRRLSQYVDVTPRNQDHELFNWLCHHLDTKVQDQKLVARVENNMFVFLSWPLKLHSLVPTSPAHFAPTLLTTLGVLFTFIGVSIGLSGLTSGDLEALSSSDLEALSESISSLLEGLSTAFHSSVAGMVAAIVSTVVVIPIATNLRQATRNQLQKVLRAIAILETPTNLLARINTEATQDAATQMAHAAKILSQLDMPGSKDIGFHVAEALKPTFTSISDDLKHQREAIEAQRQELLTSLVGELRQEVVEPVAQRLDKSAVMTHDASEAVREFKNELGGISQSLADSTETIQKFQIDTLKDLQSFADSLQGTLNDFQSETKGVLTQMGTDVREAVDQSIAGMEAQRTAIETSADKASEVMDTARENLNSTLNNMDEMLQYTRITVQEELEKFRDGYQGSLTTFFDQQNNHLSELLNQQRQGLTKVVEDLRQVFQNDAQVMARHINESMTNVKNTAKTVSNLVSVLGLAEGHQMAQLKELADSMGDEVERVEASYRNMQTQLEQALKTGNEQLSDYLKQASDVYSQQLQNLDSGAVKVCEQLEEASRQLTTAAEYLVVAANGSGYSRNDNGHSNGSSNGNGSNNGNGNGNSNGKVSHV